MIQELDKRSTETISLTASQRATPTSALAPFDLTSMTAEFEVASPVGGKALITKSSTASGEITITNATAGQLDVKVISGDTENLKAGKYTARFYAINGAGDVFNLQTEEFRLVENVLPA